MEATEEPLAGGNMGPVSRRGDEVLRVAGPWTPNVHRLLDAYAASGVVGTPRALGYTDDGRERLSFVPGEVPAYPMPEWVWGEQVLADAARLLRRLHDASPGLVSVRDGWRSPVREPVEVVCHNDFALYNLVFTDGRLTGVIDFDYCSPGPRIWDVAYLAYTLVPLNGALEAGAFTASERAARLERLVEAYGGDLTASDVVPVVVDRLRDLADFSDRAAVQLANPDLHRHATGYRADAARLASGLLS